MMKRVMSLLLLATPVPRPCPVVRRSPARATATGRRWRAPWRS